jgi:predicted RNA binding protein YcfA (HicA-like mRNA interferase family)
VSPPSGPACVRALQRAGFTVLRQTGSHVRLAGPSGQRVTVPLHGAKPLFPSTFASVLRQAGLTAESLRALL